MDSFPQLVSVGTYLAVCAFIYKLFEKGDDLINDDAKRQLEGWILNLKAPGKMQNWPTLFAHWFDRVFGEKHLSWKCFFRSCLAIESGSAWPPVRIWRICLPHSCSQSHCQ